ncbi:hypothetical protein SAMN05216504_1113 [Pseudomonas sp. A214]|nr:hypothetical protein SAMN05216504_1113 [Pseudomonas sp. A214]
MKPIEALMFFIMLASRGFTDGRMTLKNTTLNWRTDAIWIHRSEYPIK